MYAFQNLIGKSNHIMLFKTYKPLLDSFYNQICAINIPDTFPGPFIPGIGKEYYNNPKKRR